MSEAAKTLYVGNLHSTVTEEFMHFLFSQVGACISCKMIYEHGQDPYCFVEFAEHYSACQALATLNGRVIHDKPMKVNWATSPNSKNVTDSTQRVDTSEHFHVFCGDLSTDIETKQLREAFEAFGAVSDCKVISDIATNKSKGYGFISFVNKEEAQKAIDDMNGAWLGNRAIRTNWATRKPPAPVERTRQPRTKNLSYDEVFAQASDTNCTVYVGGITEGLHDELLQDVFKQFGNVAEVRCFKEKGFAFVRMESKAAAAQAIVGLNGKEVAGYPCRCAWGKESNDSQRQQQQGFQQQGYQQQGYGGYNNQSYGGNWNNYGMYNQQQQQPQQQWPAQQQWGGQQQWGAQQQQWGGQWNGQEQNWQQQQNYPAQQQQSYGAGDYNYNNCNASTGNGASGY